MNASLNNRDNILLQWKEAAKALEVAKEAELNLRRLAIEATFGKNIEEGTNTVDLGNGYKIKCVGRMNYKLPDYDTTIALLAKLRKAGPEGGFIADRLVKFKPEISVTEYRALPDKMAKIVNEALTITPGTPSLELVEPKAK